MNLLALLRDRFAAALASLADDPSELARLVVPSHDPKFGDYQANCAMPLARQQSRPPREIAQEIIRRLDVEDICHTPEIAGPGFINLRLRDAWLVDQLGRLLQDEDRLGVPLVDRPKTYVLDYPSPNVAKPLHVGHIRSTVIGDCLYRLLTFVGHRAISDNHIGDWGTQFGMIIYGFKHFVDRAAYQREPMEELGRLYRLVQALVSYHATRVERIPALEAELGTAEAEVERLSDEAVDTGSQTKKKQARKRKEACRRLADLRQELTACHARVTAIDEDATLARLAREHEDIGHAVLDETARLHAGDPENRRLWEEFLPPCLRGIDAIYDRLGVTFDHTLGESFYHDRLAKVVEDLTARGLAVASDGAVCVFLDGSDTPMIIRKKDGAFLYATTDLATLEYRIEHFAPDAILYVVGQPQALHFRQLFAAARQWGYQDVELAHVAFGTVMGTDGKPFRTRSGDVVGLAGLLDEAVERAYAVVSANDDAKPTPELDEAARRRVAEVVGIGALKYADLSQNRDSDYVFSYEKMLAMKGNTATYMQYSYARVRSIFRKGRISDQDVRRDPAPLVVEHPAERALARALLQLPEAIDRALVDNRPNHLTAYLLETAGAFADFFQQCPVLRAESDTVKLSRLKLCDLTARTLRLGLSLLGIDVVEKM